MKGIAGFYYVYTEERGLYECKAKGIFRKDGQKPLVGDDVRMTVLDEPQKTGSIEELLPRKNALIRPAVANVDQAMIIFAVTKPVPNLNLLDRFLLMMAKQGIPCIICFNKQDLANDEDCRSLRETYENCGCKVVFSSALEKEGIAGIKSLLAGKTTTVAGPSGVGKSSLVNRLQQNKIMETGNLSSRLDRGKHTTRHTELLPMGADTFILDTPGFSSLGLFDMKKEELSFFYPEFAAYESKCRFGGCSHITEPGCGVKEALEAGLINRQRYENYVAFYEELKNKKKYGKAEYGNYRI